MKPSMSDGNANRKQKRQPRTPKAREPGSGRSAQEIKDGWRPAGWEYIEEDQWARWLWHRNALEVFEEGGRHCTFHAFEALAAATMNVWPAPSARVFGWWLRSVCVNVSGLGVWPRPRWRSAQPGPHNHSGLGRPFDFPGSRAAVRLSGHLPFTTRRQSRLSGPEVRQPTHSHTAAAADASKERPHLRTAQTIRASLAASATTTTFLCARFDSALAHRPSGVSWVRILGSTARAPWIRFARRYRFPRLDMPRRRGLPPVVA